MRKLIASLAAVGLAALSGCVAYGGGTYSTGGVYYDNSPYYGSAPYYGSSGVAVVIQQRSGYPYSTYGANRRDRDGDGVPNWRDTRPDNPRRY
jgi:hypothetical protein